ncbi:hypothetical protein [Flavobacterium sp. C4GT6]|uniref:hypothetical protein n=1 Tax=Flavobacterium sp. C4GT6 TaxID=3103818 RepID=UPI002ED422E2
MNKKNISPSQTLTIHEIFTKKGWEVNSDSKVSLCNNYIQRISVLPDDSEDLFIDLTQRFENITLLSQIISLFKEAYKKIHIEIIDKSRRIYSLQLISASIRL